MRIFLSYRRDDSSAWTGRLADALAGRFGEENVFQDVVAVRPGERFTDAIERALGEADATLAVIGPRWLTATGVDGTPRLSDPHDHVRRELQLALQSGKTVVPVLVGGAAMPTAAQLPDDLQPLSTLQAVVLRDESWHRELDVLLQGLRGARGHQRAGRRRSRAPLAVAVATAAALAGFGTWALLRQSDEPSEGSTAGTVVEPDTCPTPRPPGWADLDRLGTAGGGPGAGWRFEVTGGGSRSPAPDRWQVVLRVSATNLAAGSQIHYPFYVLVLDGEVVELDCFQVVDGPVSVGPSESSTALVGFEVDRAPTGALALDVDSSGERFRIDLEPS